MYSTPLFAVFKDARYFVFFFFSSFCFSFCFAYLCKMFFRSEIPLGVCPPPETALVQPLSCNCLSNKLMRLFLRGENNPSVSSFDNFTRIRSPMRFPGKVHSNPVVVRVGPRSSLHLATAFGCLPRQYRRICSSIFNVPLEQLSVNYFKMPFISSIA